MRTKKFILNSIFAALVSVATMISTFVITQKIIYSYGSDMNGLIMSINQFVFYFTLLELGVSAAAIHALFKPVAYDDKKDINGIVSASSVFFKKLTIITLVFTVLLSIIYPFIIKRGFISVLDVSLIFFFTGISVSISFFTYSKYRVFLTAVQKTYVLSISSLIQILLGLIIFLLMARYQVDMWKIKFVILGSFIIRGLFLYLYMRIKYPSINHNSKPDTGKLHRKWDAFYLQILGVFTRSFPIVIISIFVSLQRVSLFGVYNLVIVGVTNLLSVFMNGLSPIFGEIIITNSKNTLKSIYNEFEVFYNMLMTIIFSAVAVLYIPFIEFYTIGAVDYNYVDYILGYLFLGYGFLYNIKAPRGMMILSSGLFKETKKQVTIQASIIVIISMVLIWRMNIYGVLIAMILSNLYRTIELNIFVPKWITFDSSKRSFTRIASVIIQILIISVIANLLLEIELSSFYDFIVYGVLVSVLSIIIVVIYNYIFEKNAVVSIIKRVRELPRQYLKKNENKRND